MGKNRKVGEIKGKREIKELIRTREGKRTKQDRKCVFKNEMKRGEKEKQIEREKDKRK